MANKPKWIRQNGLEEFSNSHVFVFDITFLNGHKQKIELMADLDIDYDNLESQLQDIPAQYMYWAALYSEQKSLVSVVESKIESHRAKIAKKIIEEFRTGGARLTDKQLNMIVDEDEDLQEMSSKLISLQKKVGKLYHMVEAIKMKSELARSLSGFKRQDRDQSVKQK